MLPCPMVVCSAYLQGYPAIPIPTPILNDQEEWGCPLHPSAIDQAGLGRVVVKKTGAP